MKKYVIYHEFNRRRLTTEENYNTCMRDESKIVDMSNFESDESAKQYLITYCKLSDEQIIIR